MRQIKLWGRINSLNVQKVAWALEELGLDYHRIDAGSSYGLLDSVEFANLNPNRLVPVVEDNGFVMWESNAIVRHLVSKYGREAIWQKGVEDVACADKWMDWQSGTFWPALTAAYVGLVRTPLSNQDAQSIQASVIATERCASILDDTLSRTRFLAGSRFSSADIAIGVVAHRWLNLPIDRETRPHLARWFDEIQARPAIANVLSLPLV